MLASAGLNEHKASAACVLLPSTSYHCRWIQTLVDRMHLSLLSVLPPKSCEPTSLVCSCLSALESICETEWHEFSIPEAKSSGQNFQQYVSLMWKQRPCPSERQRFSSHVYLQASARNTQIAGMQLDFCARSVRPYLLHKGKEI